MRTPPTYKATAVSTQIPMKAMATHPGRSRRAAGADSESVSVMRAKRLKVYRQTRFPSVVTMKQNDSNAIRLSRTRANAAGTAEERRREDARRSGDAPRRRSRRQERDRCGFARRVGVHARQR